MQMVESGDVDRRHCGPVASRSAPIDADDPATLDPGPAEAHRSASEERLRQADERAKRKEEQEERAKEREEQQELIRERE